MPTSEGAPLALDHVSLRVPTLELAGALLSRLLGLRLTRTPQAPEEHGRIFLHRSYLEVAPVSPAGADAAGLAAVRFFLRYDDAQAVRAALPGLSVTLEPYQGRDGLWEDLQLGSPEAELFTLVRRTAPREVARDWPPPLAQVGSAGVRALAGVVLATPSLDEASVLFSRFVGAAGVGLTRADAALGARRVDVQLAAGKVVLVERPVRAVEAVLLSVTDMAAAASLLSSQGVSLQAGEGGELWLAHPKLGPARFGLVPEVSPQV